MTDTYIGEEAIKLMKTNKKDIIEIVPKIVGENVDNVDIGSFSEKPFEEIFKEFYFKERKVEPQQEVVDTLLSIMNGGEEENETN